MCEVFQINKQKTNQFKKIEMCDIYIRVYHIF